MERPPNGSENDGAALTYAEVKAIASGNPLVIEKAGIDAEVGRLGRLQTQHSETQFKLRQRIRHWTEDLPRLKKRLEATRQDTAIRQDTRADNFIIELDGETIRDRGIAGALINRWAERLNRSQSERCVGNFAGFKLFVCDTFIRGPEIVLKGAATHTAKVSDAALGTMRSVEYAVQNLEETKHNLEQSIKESKKHITDLNAQCGQTFEYSDRLAALVQRQQEIADALDLTKNQASSQLESDSSDDVAAPSTETATSLREMGFAEYEY